MSDAYQGGDRPPLRRASKLSLTQLVNNKIASNKSNNLSNQSNHLNQAQTQSIKSFKQSNKRFQRRPVEERKEALISNLVDQSSDEDADTEQSYGEESSENDSEELTNQSINQTNSLSFDQTKPLKQSSGTESTESGDDDDGLHVEIEAINQSANSPTIIQSINRSNNSSARPISSQAIIIPRTSPPPTVSIDQSSGQQISQPIRAPHPLSQTANRSVNQSTSQSLQLRSVPYYMQNSPNSQTPNYSFNQSNNHSAPSSPVTRYGLPPPPSFHGQSVNQSNVPPTNNSDSPINRPYSPRPPLHPMSLPTYQANQPGSPSFYQPPVSQSPHQSIQQSVNTQLAIPPTVARPVSRSFDHPNNQAMYRPPTPSHQHAQSQPLSATYNSTNQPINQSSVNQSTNQGVSAYRRVSDASSDSSTNQSINHLIEPRTRIPSNQSTTSTVNGSPDDPANDDLFTVRGWQTQSAECLLATSSAVDACCRAIVLINQHINQSGSLGGETRRLALTVAVFERSLYAYALRILTLKQSNNTSSSTQNTPTTQPRHIPLLSAMPVNRFNSIASTQDIDQYSNQLNQTLHQTLSRDNSSSDSLSSSLRTSRAHSISQSIPPTVVAPFSSRSTDAGNFFAPQPINQSINSSMTPTHHQLSPRSISPIDSLLQSPQIRSSTPSPTNLPISHSPIESSPQPINQSIIRSSYQPAGMSCLLKILTDLLLECQSILLETNDTSTSFIRYLKHLIGRSIDIPIKSANVLIDHPKPTMIVASTIAVISMIASTKPARMLGRSINRLVQLMWMHCHTIYHSLSVAKRTEFLLSFVPVWCRRLTIFLMDQSPRLLLCQLQAAIHTRAAVTIVPLTLYLMYRFAVWRRVQKLKQVHSRLGLMLRLWHICYSLVEVDGQAQSQSNNQANDQSNDDLLRNSEAPRVPISRWLLQLVPPELDSSFWYHRNLSLKTIKYGMDVLYCATYMTMKYFGKTHQPAQQSNYHTKHQSSMIKRMFGGSSSRRPSQYQLDYQSSDPSIDQSLQLFGTWNIGLPYFLACGIYFACNPSTASSMASKLMSSPDITLVKAAWALLDIYLARALTLNVLPYFGYSKGFAVCQEIELISLEEDRSLNDASFEYDFDTTKSKHSKLTASLTGYKSKQHVSTRLKESMLDDDFMNDANQSDPSLSVLLLSGRPLRLKVNLRFHRSPSSASIHSSPSRASSPVIIYFHGGGWITDFRASHLHFLSQWTDSLDVPIIYVNYSLIDQSSNHAYPTALHECYDVYRWVIEGRLGLDASSVLLVGDSTGANLAAACCMKAIIEQVRIPDGIILACPILNLRSTPTPSRSLYMTDPVLPMNLLLQLRTLYLTHHVSTQQHTLVDSDPCLSPIVASDELLAQWPPTGIMVGSYDPFVDDSVDFAHRLVENGVRVKLRIFEEAPHSLWDFAPVLGASQEAVDLVSKWAKHMLDDHEKKSAHDEDSD